MARDHRDENAYLKAVSEWAKEIRNHSNDFIEDWGLQNELTKSSFIKCMNKLVEHINATLAVPISDRGPAAF
jgi:hypothetical protein